MKKMIIALAMLSLLGSCNRKLKKEIAEMDVEIGQLKNKQNNTTNILGIDEPIIVTFSSTNLSNVPVTNNRSYQMKGVDYYSQRILNLNNGTFQVHVSRMTAIDERYEAYISFTYNPTTGIVSDSYVDCAFVDVYGDDRIAEFYNYDPNATLNVTVNAFNATTGQVSVFVSANTTAASIYNIYSGKAMSGSWSFTGTLPIYQD